MLWSSLEFVVNSNVGDDDGTHIWRGIFQHEIPRLSQPTKKILIHSINIRKLTLTKFKSPQTIDIYHILPRYSRTPAAKRTPPKASPVGSMAQTSNSHTRSHSLLLLQKLLNLRDGSSPLTLILDSLEQTAQPALTEFISRAKVCVHINKNKEKS